MSRFISSYNKKLLNSCTGTIKPCNCGKKDECALNGQCLAQDIVHKRIASALINPDETYLGTAKGILRKDTKTTQNHLDKNGHKKRILSKYIWEIKKEYNEMPTLKCSIVNSVPS